MTRLDRLASATLAAAGVSLGLVPGAGAQDAAPVEVAPTATPEPTPAAATPAPTPLPTPAATTDGATDLGTFDVTVPAGARRPRPVRRPAKPKPKPAATPSPAPTATPDPASDGGEVGLGDGKTRSLRVPGVVLDAFAVPPFLLPIYQAAGMQYGVDWELLAAINAVETDSGRNVAVSAGALGWMQFMPATWAMYGVDANGDGLKDPYNPADAIFAAARYLRAAGAQDDVRRGVFAYNHADWYVDDVLLRARKLVALPPPLVNALTGLAQGRMPVQGTATIRRAGGRTPAARIVTRRRAEVLAVSDARVLRIGRRAGLGRFVQVQDAFGNTFTYAHLGSVAATHPVPRTRAQDDRPRRLRAPERDAAPRRAASETTRRALRERERPRRDDAAGSPAPHGAGADRRAPSPRPAKARLFANPARPQARAAGGDVQLAERGYRPHSGQVLRLDKRDYRARPLRKGSRVLAGTALGRAAAGPGKRSRFEFRVRPGGPTAPAIDPRPILAGYDLLDRTAVFSGDSRSPLSIGRALLLDKSALQRQVLDDPRLSIYACGRRDIRIGAVDRRVLAALEFLADAGLHSTVSSLRCGHGYLTASGNVSAHSSGDAFDIAAVNGTPILGHQGPGSVTERVIERLLELQGPAAPNQIISLMTVPGAPTTMAMGDHGDHVHVGFRPDAQDAAGDGHDTLAAAQWTRLAGRLARMDQPDVRDRPSRYAVRVRLPQRNRAAAARRP